MRVLVACEYSGVVRDAFIARGHDAMSCDLIEAEGSHYAGDVRDILGDSWDLMIAHPPCTHLSVSGARWFKGKEQEQRDALYFFDQLWRADIPKICIENPVGIASTHIEKPTQIVHPYHFGEPVSKATCLWLKGLPKLVPTDVVEPEWVTFPNGKRQSKWYYETSLATHDQRGHLRSKTFQGIANAMADQWGNEPE
jgi:site-specific DNA-cytosine methylase